MRSLLILGLTIIVACPSAYLLATCGGGGGGGGQKKYKTRWTPYEEAKADAEKARYGIVFYFPALQGDTEDHSMFRTKLISEQSLRSPMVRIKDDKHVEVRKEYKVNEKLHTVIITDWNGNPINPKPFVTRRAKQKLPLKKVLRTIQSADNFVGHTRSVLKKKLAKGEKALEKRNWKAALKALLPAAELKGFKEADKAREHLETIAEEGRKAIEDARKLPAAEAKKALRKVSRDFRGSVVEEEARKALAELSGTAYHPQPDAGEVERFLDEHRAAFPLVELDDEWFARAMEVQHRVLEGAAAERSHHYPDALRLYEAAVELDPRDVVARRFLGEYHRHHSGEWQLARQHFQAILALDADSYSRAMALHGLGKMTIHGGEFAKGVKMIEESVSVHPTQLAHRNLAVYWFSEGQVERARDHVRSAVALGPEDPYTRVFAAVYRAEDGDHEGALQEIAETPFDLSMSYNIACVYSHMRDKTKVLEHLRRHFYEYEFTDKVRAKEMWEARTDANFKWLARDPEFLEVTGLAVDETGRKAADSR